MTSIDQLIVQALTSSAPTPKGGIWCSECEHEREEKDPYGTGDPWYIVKECALPKCPYGKTEMDQE